MNIKHVMAVMVIIGALHVSIVNGQETDKIIKKPYPSLRGIPHVVTWRESIVGGGAPSEEDIRIASELGFKTIIDLRSVGEGSLGEKVLVHKYRMNYIRIEVTEQSLSRHKAEYLAGYVRNPENLPLIVHCSDGQRAAALYALYINYYEDVDAEEALKKAQGAGLKTGPIMDKTKQLLGIKKF